MLPALFAAVLVVALVTASGSEDPLAGQGAWPNTDFSKRALDPAEILSGGPPKDGIPAITGPRMIPAVEEDRLEAREPVMVYEPEGAPAPTRCAT